MTENGPNLLDDFIRKHYLKSRYTELLKGLPDVVTAQIEYEGGCSCRKLRYKLNADPLIVHACHCRQCQRVTGSAFVMNALIEKEEVEHLCGDIANIRFPNTCHTAFFCPDCATYVWSQYKSGRFDDCWFIRVGTLDEPNHLPPSVHIFLESKQPWVVIPEKVPQFERFYKIKDVWTKTSIDRMGKEGGSICISTAQTNGCAQRSTVSASEHALRATVADCCC